MGCGASKEESTAEQGGPKRTSTDDGEALSVVEPTLIVVPSIDSSPGSGGGVRNSLTDGERSGPGSVLSPGSVASTVPYNSLSSEIILAQLAPGRDSPPPPEDPHSTDGGVIEVPTQEASDNRQDDKDGEFAAFSGSTTRKERCEIFCSDTLGPMLPARGERLTIEQQKQLDVFFDSCRGQTSGGGGGDVLLLSDLQRGLKKHRLHDVARHFATDTTIENAVAGVHRFLAGKRGKAFGGDDKILRSEFRLVLCYLRSWFSLFIVLDEVDSSEDRRVDCDEFCRMVPLLLGWGLRFDAPGTGNGSGSGGEVDEDRERAKAAMLFRSELDPTEIGMVPFEEVGYWVAFRELSQHYDASAER